MDLRLLMQRGGRKSGRQKRDREIRKDLKGNSILDSIRQTSISCTMGPNLNICGMVNDIIKIIQQEDLAKIDALQQEMDKYSSNLENSNAMLTKFTLMMYTEEKNNREIEIERIRAGGNVSSFRMETIGIVQRHSILDRENDVQERKNLVRSFLIIARRYCNIHVTMESNNNQDTMCPECENKDIEITNQGSYLCGECFNEWPIIVKYGSVSVEDDKAKSSGGYQTRENFRKAFKKFQGIHNNIQDRKSVYSLLDSYFLKEYGRKRSYFIGLKRNADGSKGPYNKDVMLKALEETGNSSLYRDVNTILSELWGWSCRDLDIYRNAIFASYDTFVDKFETVYGDKPFPSNGFFLYVFINKARMEAGESMISKHEFKIIKTESILNNHVERFRNVCKILARNDKSWLFYNKIKW